MIKHELLAPAGDMESLKQAVANGADAIYVGCKNFGARKYAKNFDNDEIIFAIRLCHLYGVKIYAAMNTLVKDEEVPYFLGQVEYLHKNGIDAIIIQDFGMLCLIREKYPNLELHASTQANAASKDTIKFLHEIGVKRVVLPREMSLEQIEDIKVPIEKEVFIHGALCTCYSGCCLMSSMLGKRSGNRGECAGCCRLPYTLERNGRIIEEEQYLLSTKELNTSPKFRELLESDIISFKIEGRMKSPEYVGFITRFYRNIIDTYCTNINFEQETDRLKTIFNRGFTIGHIFKASPTDLMNRKSPNHIGNEIGRVLEITDKKIKLKLTKELNQYDGIRFLKSGKGFIVNYLYDENDNLINHATDICYVDNKVDLKDLDKVCKTQDSKLLEELKILPARKIPITFRMTAKRNHPIILEISDGLNKLRILGSTVEQSLTSPIDAERIRVQLEKLGDTPFVSTATLVDADPEIFISIKELNELRRTITTNLMQLRMDAKKDVVIRNVNLDVIKTELKPTLTASVYTEEQLITCNNLKIKRIYVENKELYNKYKMNENIYYRLPRYMKNPLDILKRANLISEYIDFSAKDNSIGNYSLNVTNIYTAYYLYKKELDVVTLSVELSESEIINFINNYIKTFNVYPNFEILGYGRVENMIIKDNILNIKENDYKYTLVDSKKRIFPVYYDGINTHILNHENNSLENIEILKKHFSIRLDFYDEDEMTIRNIVNKYR